MRACGILLLLLVASSSLFAFQGKPRGIEVITANQMRAYLSFIASDELEGRLTPSRGLDIAAKFLATNLTNWGFKPAGDNGTYFQKISILRTKIDTSDTWLEINGQKFQYGVDFLCNINSGSISAAPLVYIGHQYMIKAKNLDPFKDLDVKGKIVVWTSDFPKGVTFQDLSGKQGEDWQNGYTYAAKNGAVGGIVIASYNTMAGWENNRRTNSVVGGVQVEKFIKDADPTMTTVTLSPRAANALFAGEKENGSTIFRTSLNGEAAAGFELRAEKKVSFKVSARKTQEWTQNVVAIWEGDDSKLKNEYVAIGAHYDHVGTAATAVNGDWIFNGADDDGSGTTAILAIAEAFAKSSRPDRSILFVWHCGEERGLWGSKYFVDNPTVPLANVVAQLNMDMVGRSKKAGDTDPRNKELSGPNEIYVIGSTMMSTELGKLSERANKSYLNLDFNTKYDDPKDPNRFFFRSDHFNYAQKGIPVLFYFDGVHEDYHQLGDEWQKIDYNKMEKVARTVYATARELSGSMKRPVVDKQLPKELTQ